MNLPHPVDINKFNPLNWYGQICTEESILFNLPWQVNIKGSKNHQYQWIHIYSWYWWIYLIKSISMNLTQWVSMDKSTETSQQWWICTKEPILINISQCVDIDKYILTIQYWQIYTEGPILMNLSKWVNINEYTQKSWYWRIYPNGSVSMNLHCWIDIDISILINLFWCTGIIEFMPISEYQGIFYIEFTLTNWSNRLISTNLL